MTPIAGTESGGQITDVQWTPEGIQLLHSATLSRFTFERLSDPQSKFSTPVVEYPELPGPGVLAADGRSFAFVIFYCAKTSSFFGCDKSQALVHHADAVQRTWTRIAVHTVREEVDLSISPDGRRAAYVLDRWLYVVPAN